MAGNLKSIEKGNSKGKEELRGWYFEFAKKTRLS